MTSDLLLSSDIREDVILYSPQSPPNTSYHTSCILLDINQTHLQCQTRLSEYILMSLTRSSRQYTHQITLTSNRGHKHTTRTTTNTTRNMTTPTSTNITNSSLFEVLLLPGYFLVYCVSSQGELYLLWGGYRGQLQHLWSGCRPPPLPSRSAQALLAPPASLEHLAS